jgi:hypothetical protein
MELNGVPSEQRRSILTCQGSQSSAQDQVYADEEAAGTPGGSRKSLDDDEEDDGASIRT